MQRCSRSCNDTEKAQLVGGERNVSFFPAIQFVQAFQKLAQWFGKGLRGEFSKGLA